MPTASEIVGEKFAIANSYATTHMESLKGFTNALNESIYAPPTLSVTWVGLEVPKLPELPRLPEMPDIAFDAPTAPGEWTLAEPVIAIDTFTEAAPTLTLPDAPGALVLAEPSVNISEFIEDAPVITLGAAPTVSYGDAPAIPAVGAIPLPTAPTLPTVTAPTYLTLSTPTFSGVDLHLDYLANLETIPTLDLVAPTPYTYAPGPEYASTLLSSLKATLNARMSGGTGLSPAVEQALWDRARDRETKIALGNEAEVMRASEALGFQIPPGVLVSQVRDAQKDYYDKLSTLSRDISIKQAELEQENLKQTIAAGMQLEGTLIDYSYKLEQLTFESAKETAANAIAAYNAQVDQFKALLTAYNTYAAAYDTIIKAELGKVEVYKAQLAGEQAKADINTALVQQYKAAIEAGMAYVEIYKAEVGAANTLIQLEQTKISAAGEQIKAYVATVNAETSKVEAYKAGAQVEALKVDIFKAKTGAYSALTGAQAEKARAEISRYTALSQAKANEWDGYKAGVQAETTKIDVFKAKAGAFSAVSSAQAEKARAEISRYTALSQSKANEWDGYRAKVSAESERVRALGAQSGALLDGYKAAAASVEAEAAMHTKIWETQIKQYDAGQQIAIQAAKINGDWTIATNNARLDAAKVGAQTYAQLTSSAYGMVNASASINGGASMSVSYSYSNDTTTAAPTLTAI